MGEAGECPTRPSATAGASPRFRRRSRLPRRCSASRTIDCTPDAICIDDSMSSDHEQPAPKRQRLEEPATVDAAPAPLTAAASSSLIANFFTPDAQGLPGVLAHSIGKRAANEDEVGITEYVSPDVAPFAGIIKHRSVSICQLYRGRLSMLTLLWS